MLMSFMPSTMPQASQNVYTLTEKLLTELITHPDLPVDRTKHLHKYLKKKDIWDRVYNSNNVFADYAVIRKDRRLLTLFHEATSAAIAKQRNTFASRDTSCKRWAHFSSARESLYMMEYRFNALECLLALERCLKCVESWQSDLESGAENTGTVHLSNTHSLRSRCHLPDLWKQQLEMMRQRGSCHVKKGWFREETEAGIYGVLDGLKELGAVPPKDVREVKTHTKKRRYIEALFALDIIFVKFNYHKEEKRLVQLLKTTWDYCLAYCRLNFEKRPSSELILYDGCPSTRYYLQCCTDGWRIISRWYELHAESREVS